MDANWTVVLQTIIWALVFIIVVASFSNGFGLFDKTYKGRWTKVPIQGIPEVMKRLKDLDAFRNSDGSLISIEITVQLDSSSNTYVPAYKVKIPESTFHKVEHDVILKELGIK